MGAVNTVPVLNSACGVELRILCAATPASDLLRILPLVLLDPDQQRFPLVFLLFSL